MLADTDLATWTAIAGIITTVIASTAAAVVSIIVAFRQSGVKSQVDEVHAAVSTSNGTTLAGAVEDIARKVS